MARTQLDLAGYVALFQPTDLSFANHVHSLITLDRVQRTFYRAKPVASHDALLDKTMILLEHIVPVG
jgi:hypothetical protein